MQPSKFNVGDDAYYPAKNSMFLGKVIGEMISGSGSASTYLVQGFGGQVDAFYEAQLMTPNEYNAAISNHAAVAAHYMGMTGVFPSSKFQGNGPSKLQCTDLDILGAMHGVKRHNDKGFEIKLKNPCECGAHAVKDARHSNWCPLNN